ncbi:MAG: hypothetical protein IJW14_03625, partial [Oscillospiraceae bacterium]|nr:hypothetical protein [Oscillospiraceae bacterium]
FALDPRLREGFLGEGAFCEATSASPMPISLVTFLFGNKKVTRPTAKQAFILSTKKQAARGEPGG